MSEDQFFLNGIDGVTGEYLVPPMSAESVVRLIRPTADREQSGWLKRIQSLFTRPFRRLAGRHRSDRRRACRLGCRCLPPDTLRDAQRPGTIDRASPLPGAR